MKEYQATKTVIMCSIPFGAKNQQEANKYAQSLPDSAFKEEDVLDLDVEEIS